MNAEEERKKKGEVFVGCTFVKTGKKKGKKADRQKDEIGKKRSPWRSKEKEKRGRRGARTKRRGGGEPINIGEGKGTPRQGAGLHGELSRPL